MSAVTLMRRYIALLLVALACSPATTKLPESAPGNSCASAIELTWPESGPLVIDTTVAPGMADHMSCYGQVGPDVIYRFSAPRAGALVARSDGIVTLTNVDCVFRCALPQAKEPWVAAPGFIKRVEAGETLGLIIELGMPGRTTLDLFPLTPGDRCEDAIEVELDGGVPWSFIADLRLTFSESAFVDDHGDVFFHVPIRERSVLHLRSNGYPHARAACSSTTETIFNLSDDVEVDAGDLWLSLWIPDAPQIDEPRVRDLSVSLTPLQPSDACDQPGTLVFVSDGGVQSTRVSGDLSGFGSAFSTTCIGATADAFFLARLSQPQSLHARLTTTTPNARPALELRTSCARSDSATCATAIIAGAGATLDATALPAGDYLLRIGNAGAWTLDVTLTP